MKYDQQGNPADLEAAYRWIEQAGYGYALDPIKAHIAQLESTSFDVKRNAQLQQENESLHRKLRTANNEIAHLRAIND